MGRFDQMTAELPKSRLTMKDTIEMMRRTVEALRGAPELPLSRVKVPAGGGKAFEFPGPTPDDPAYVSAFEGVILSGSYFNAYWAHPFGEGGGDRAPDCMSQDGISGWDRDGLEHVCKTCPMNRMGSRDGGRGKACRNMARLLVMVEGEPLPIELSVPTMSVQNYALYVARVLTPRGLLPCQVSTKFSLMKTSNAAGIDYSQIMFSCTGRIDDGEIQGLMGELRPMLAGATEQTAIEAAEA